MAYFNHAFTKLFLGTHATQAADATHKGVDQGFLTSSGVPSVNLITTASPYQLGLGVYGLFSPKTYLSVNAASIEITTGAPLVLASTALYQNDKIGPFHGGYQESTKSKTINPKYVSRFYRVDPCNPNPNVIHVGNTPFTRESGVSIVSITTAGSGYNISSIITGVSFSGGTGSGALATITTNGAGTITNVVFTTPGTGFNTGNILVPVVGSGFPALTFTPGVSAALTVTLLTSIDATCCKEFLCDEMYFLRIDVKGSPELRYLSRNGYWNVATYTGCCPANCGTPVAVDSTEVFIAWATEALADRIVGPFLNFVIYDELGVAWYAPGDAGKTFSDPGMIDLSPGVATLAITNGGSGYTNGVYTNVGFANKPNSVHVGALATVTVAGGIVTVVTITSPGMSYKVGDILDFPAVDGNGSGATFMVTSLITPTWDNYVSTGHIPGACAGMKIMGAYVDTKFGDCTFYPNDFFEKEPVKIYASLVDETGDVCEFSGLCVETQCQPRQGMGFGEEVLRDLILSESYMQNYFYTGTDLRIREVTQGYDVTAAINRSSLYTRYFILHNVPRFNNPTGVFDNDQYMIQVITNAVSATFESTMATWLTACSCSASLEINSCGPTCGGSTCAVFTFVPVAGVVAAGTVGVPYVFTPIAVTGGTAPYTFEVTGGVLPTGLVLGATTGDITGTPTVAGDFTFSVTVLDEVGCETSVTYTIIVS